MDSITLLRRQLKEAHDFLEETIADVKPDHLQWAPPGTANPVAGTYAHAITNEDMVVQGMLQGKQPLAATTFAGKTGLDRPVPGPTESWAEAYPRWVKSVRVDLPMLREYARAVYAATDAYLATLQPEDLDLPTKVHWGGEAPLAWIVDRILLGHIDNVCGEVAVLKGIQGAKGYSI